MIEKNIKKLETLVADLESDDIDLNKAAEQYQEAIKIASKIMTDVKKLEKKILVLKKEGEQLITDAL